MNPQLGGSRTSTAAAKERTPWILLFIAVCLVAVNMRMTITGVGPLLEEIGADQAVSPSVLGLLGSVPLLSWALFSPVAHGLSTRIGMSNGVSLSLALLIAGTVWRSLDGSDANLWLGTALTGAGLAVANVLMPAIIKREFPERLTLVMGAYSALLSGLGAIAAGVAVPLSNIQVDGETLGWQLALLITGILLPPALAVWIWATRPGGARGESASTRTAALAAEKKTPGRTVWRDPVAWLVSFYMGAQSTSFYILATWFPTYLVDLGTSPVAAGVSLMMFQFFGILGSLLLPFVTRGRLERWIPAALPTVGIVAWLGFVFAPSAMPLWIAVGGFIAGAFLTMSLTLMATRARTHRDSSAVSGMAQSVGYLLAAGGPVTFGFLHEVTGGWVASFGVMWLMGAALIVIGLAVGRPRYVFDRVSDDPQDTSVARL